MAALESRLSKHMDFDYDHHIFFKMHPKPSRQKILAANADLEFGIFQSIQAFSERKRLEF